MLRGCGTKEPERKQIEPRTVKAPVITVGTSDAASFYEATGTIRPFLDATLSSKVMARVIEVRVREGESVKKGQLLLQLDSREASSAVAVAEANYRASLVGAKNAVLAADMESKTSAARIVQAEAQVAQAKAGVAAARSKLDLTLAGPRVQEKMQAHLAVVQAQSQLDLANAELDRASQLYSAGAIAMRQLDVARSAHDVARAQYASAVEGEKIAIEGARTQEIQAAQDGLRQAQGALREAQAGLTQARAAAMQAKVRSAEIEAAKAQVSQSAASVESARAGLAYASLAAPFDGRIVRRFADPGSMAGPGAPLLEIEGGEYRLEASIPESVLPGIKSETTLPVRIDSLGRSFETRVVEIAPQGDPTTHMFTVKLQVAGDGLKSGMYGRARIPQPGAKSILIPKSATWEREGLRYVFAVDSTGTARLRIVTLGAAVGDKIEALSGVSPGDKLVEKDVDRVMDGDRVSGN